MSWQTWTTYGYGICVDDIQDVTVDKLKRLLNFAPIYEADINEWLCDCEVDNPTLEDYYEYDQDWCLELATTLKEVILEAEGVNLTACDDFNGGLYLIYEPRYPWDLTEKDKIITKELLAKILEKYISILTDKKITVGYQSVENGG